MISLNSRSLFFNSSCSSFKDGNNVSSTSIATAMCIAVGYVSLELCLKKKGTFIQLKFYANKQILEAKNTITKYD